MPRPTAHTLPDMSLPGLCSRMGSCPSWLPSEPHTRSGTPQTCPSMAPAPHPWLSTLQEQVSDGLQAVEVHTELVLHVEAAGFAPPQRKGIWWPRAQQVPDLGGTAEGRHWGEGARGASRVRLRGRAGIYLLIVDLQVGGTESQIRATAPALLQKAGEGPLHQPQQPRGRRPALALQRRREDEQSRCFGTHLLPPPQHPRPGEKNLSHHQDQVRQWGWLCTWVRGPIRV